MPRSEQPTNSQGENTPLPEGVKFIRAKFGYELDETTSHSYNLPPGSIKYGNERELYLYDGIMAERGKEYEGEGLWKFYLFDGKIDPYINYPRGQIDAYEAGPISLGSVRYYHWGQSEPRELFEKSREFFRVMGIEIGEPDPRFQELETLIQQTTSSQPEIGLTDIRVRDSILIFENYPTWSKIYLGVVRSSKKKNRETDPVFYFPNTGTTLNASELLDVFSGKRKQGPMGMIKDRVYRVLRKKRASPEEEEERWFDVEVNFSEGYEAYFQCYTPDEQHIDSIHPKKSSEQESIPTAGERRIYRLEKEVSDRLIKEARKQATPKPEEENG